MSASENLYTYKALQGSESFRLLEVLADSHDAPIRALLQEIPLGETPCFSALSYVWGNSTAEHELCVSGRIIKIRQNVFDFLCRQRTEGKFKIWIDAICINQTDLEERAQQVLLMPQIYESACEVLIYLGQPGEAQSHLLKGLLDGIYDLSFRKGANLNAEFIDWHNLTQYGLPEVSDSRWEALIRFLDHPWFSRIWTFQESLVARAGTFIYGDYSIDQQEFFFMAVLMLRNRLAHMVDRVRRARPSPISTALSRCEIIASHQGPLVSPFSFQRWLRSPLIGLLRENCMVESTDPRDRMFALLGVSNEANEPALKPNYTEPVNQIYKRYAVYMVEKGYGPLMLQSAARDGPADQLPSWVPCWAADSGHYGFMANVLPMRLSSFFAAAGRSVQEFRIDDGNNYELLVQGFICDEIQQLGTSEFWLSPSEYTIQRIQDAEIVLCCLIEALEMLQSIKRPYFVHESILQMLSRLSVCDIKPLTDEKAPGEYEYGLQQSLLLNSREVLWQWARGMVAENRLLNRLPNLVDNILGHPLPQGPYNYNLASRFNEVAFHTFRRLVRFLTRKGHVGQVPCGAAVGDKVVLIQGCQLPFLLRQTDDNNYLNISTCYLHGIMYGDAWEGSAAHEIRIV